MLTHKYQVNNFNIFPSNDRIRNVNSVVDKIKTAKPIYYPPNQALHTVSRRLEYRCQGVRGGLSPLKLGEIGRQVGA